MWKETMENKSRKGFVKEPGTEGKNKEGGKKRERKGSPGLGQRGGGETIKLQAPQNEQECSLSVSLDPTRKQNATGKKKGQ